MQDQIARLEPSEILTRDDDSSIVRDDYERWALTRRPAWQFGLEESQRVLHEHFGNFGSNRDGLGVSG